MPLKLIICPMNFGSLESSHYDQDDLFPSGWALGQGTDPYGLPFLTVSLAVVAAITMLQQLATLKNVKFKSFIHSFICGNQRASTSAVVDDPWWKPTAKQKCSIEK